VGVGSLISHRQNYPITKRDSTDIAIIVGMSEMLIPGRESVRGERIRARSFRRRWRQDLRTLATGVALAAAIAWTIIFGVGIVLR